MRISTFFWEFRVLAEVIRRIILGCVDFSSGNE